MAQNKYKIEDKILLVIYIYKYVLVNYKYCIGQQKSRKTENQIHK